MCAIAGILDLPVESSSVTEMLSTMRRRGPDAADHLTDRNCTLLHARLAVIDPENGAQPMTYCHGKETYTIVYNGELYNTATLKWELRKLGHIFQTQSDTEVLLHGYAQWGKAVVNMCNGIFAFAVWEHQAQRLFLARDRMGVKPLFYALHQGGLLFASEIKTILCYPTMEAKLDAQGAGEIILLGPGRTPGSGVFSNVYELEPGCCGYYEKGRLQWRRYWRLLDREHTESFEETAEVVRFLVTDAIQNQMVSDVPIGTFLSGGLDSSIISAICAREMAQRGERLQTFSVDYVGNDENFVPNAFQPNSDGHYIRLMEKDLGSVHRWCVLGTEELADALEEGTYARDLPGMADVDLSLLLFCRKIKEHVTVALSGECADEIFGGYPWYRDPKVRSVDGFPWAQNTQDRCALLSDDLKKRLNGVDYIYQRYLRTCKESDILPDTPLQERRMKEMVNLNFRWFMQTLLDRKDRMSMYSGLEVRVPFCDYRIAEYLYGVPWEFKDYQGKEKGLLRYAMNGILPDEVLWRKKSPYPKTFDPEYLELVTEKLNRVLEEKDAPLFALVSKKEVKRLLQEDMPWPWYGQLMRRPQILCYLLQINTWLKQKKVHLDF